MSKKVSYPLDISWRWHSLNHFYFCLIHVYSLRWNLVPKNNSFSNRKPALLLIKHKICLFTSLQNQIQIMKTMVKRSAIYRKIVHENLHNFLYIIRKNSYHATLECGWSIVKAKWHSSKSKYAIWTSEGDFLLIFRSYGYLVITWKSIKETIKS